MKSSTILPFLTNPTQLQSTSKFHLSKYNYIKVIPFKEQKQKRMCDSIGHATQKVEPPLQPDLGEKRKEKSEFDNLVRK